MSDAQASLSGLAANATHFVTFADGRGAVEAPPTVYIVDDDAAITAILTRIVNSLGMRPLTFNRAHDFLAAFDPSAVSCLLTDVTMPGMSGLELQQHLKQQKIPLPIVLVTGHANIPMCVAAMKEGAFHFLQKPFSPAQVKEIINRAIVADGQRRAAFAQQQAMQAGLNSLNDEERETLQLMLGGLMNKQIASSLNISLRTVQYRISALLDKLQVKTRNELIAVVTLAQAKRPEQA